MVYSYSKLFYSVSCDCCGKTIIVEATDRIRNSAYAVRSLGWTFSRQGKIRCFTCKMHHIPFKI